MREARAASAKRWTRRWRSPATASWCVLAERWRACPRAAGTDTTTTMITLCAGTDDARERLLNKLLRSREEREWGGVTRDKPVRLVTRTESDVASIDTPSAVVGRCSAFLRAAPARVGGRSIQANRTSAPASLRSLLRNEKRPGRSPHRRAASELRPGRGDPLQLLYWSQLRTSRWCK